MEWKSATKNDQGLFKIPNRWLHIHYYEAMNILFRFENSLRVFVYVILKNEFLDKWQECSFSVAGGDPNSIKGLAAKRISQAEAFGYLGFDIRAPLMHITSGELVDLITSDGYWSKFKGYFKGNKEIIKNKLLEIGTIRNSLAHFRPIKPEDIELVKQNSRHTLLGVEECLSNIFVQGLRVPTNTAEDWYKSISTLGTDQITTLPFYSADESWINVKLKFDTPILKKEKIDVDFFVFRLAKINTPNILLSHNVLAKYVTYLSEALSYPQLSEEFDIQIIKDLNFVFRKDILVKNHEAIAAEFKEVLSKITEECDLLSKDYLARGSLVETVRARSFWHPPEKEGQSGKWSHYYQELSEIYQPNHPEEYWGQYQFTSDVVSGSRRYPWMPEDISKVEGFMD
jgi:hypothetical protein